MNEVYGKYEGPTWRPKPYRDGRYLWTDAYGVCNYITLYYETKDMMYLNQADALIKDVHDVLGKDRKLKNRLGNATDDQPLKGGLRIGKVDPEGTSDGDGQYFHYLTKWMFALNRMSIARNDLKYNNWAVQLIKAIHPHFVFRDSDNELGIWWKMTIDLSKPAKMSQGNTDPYNGLMTYKLISELATEKDVLKSEIADLTSIVERKYRFYHSSDPLDLGGSLWISHFYPDEKWADTLGSIALEAIEELWQSGRFSDFASFRLAFREIGTTIALQVHPKTPEHWKARIDKVNDFWSKRLYTRDKDITPVMFCSSLIPGVLNRNYAAMASHSH